MSDKSYDVVIMGGGHNAMVLGCYLALNGMSVGIFEERWELGGGACSEEYTSPAFISNPCATSVRFGHLPHMKDLNLKEYGLKFIYPQQSGGAIFDDDKFVITRPRFEVDPITSEHKEVPDAAEKNYKSIAAVSQRDADKNEQIRELYETKWKDIMWKYVLSPPPALGEKDPIIELLQDPSMGLDPRYPFMSVGEIAFDLYDSDYMRAYWMRSTASATGCLPAATLSPAALVFTIPQLLGGSPPGITVGGTHQIAHALQRFICTHGGEFWVLSPLDKVLIENGRAKGIRLKDGTEIEAKKMVISAVDIWQTLEMIGEDLVGAELIRKARLLDTTMGPIYWGSAALHERPKYRVEAIDPEVHCYRQYLLPPDANYMRWQYQAEIFTRGYSDRCCHPYHQSSFDPTRAPEGKYEVMFEEYAPPAQYWNLREWLKKKDDFFNTFLKRWSHFAPNMTWDNIISVHFNCPYEIQMRNRNLRNGQQFNISNLASMGGQFRPLPGFSQYQLPMVKNMYLCSATAHPMGAMMGWVGYAAYKKLAQDFGLRKIWEENGRPY